MTFEPTSHFGARVDFDGWVANWDTKPFLNDDDQYVLDKSVALSAASCREFNVTDAASKPAKKAPPAPFRTATLLQAGSAALGFNPKKTMDLAQKLFAAGHINYHRTDKQNYEEESLAMIREFAAGKGWPLPEKPRMFKSVEGAQEGHEAIRPMHLEEESAGETDDERKLYQLIWKRSIASQLADAEYQVNTALLTAIKDGKTFQFKGTGRVLTSKGWLSLTARDASVEEDEADDEVSDGTVPLLAVGASLSANDGEVLSKKTQAPGRYSQASLISKMESIGIGRPSTYPAIIQNVMDREYMIEEKKKLKPTKLGMQLVVSLIKSKFSFIKFDFTSELEKKLDQIAQGTAEYKEVVLDEYNRLQNELSGLEIDAVVKHACPECAKALRRIKGANGFFWGCSGNEAGCKFTAPDEKGVPGKRKPVELTKFNCLPPCGKSLVHRKKTGKYDFFACSGYPKCDKTYKNKSGKPDFS